MTKNFQQCITLCALYLFLTPSLKRVTGSILSTIETSAERSEKICGSGWTIFKDEKCFKIMKTGDDSTPLLMNYRGALKYCRELDKDASLPSIRSEEEQGAVLNLLQEEVSFNDTGSSSKFWLGGKVTNYHNSSDTITTWEWEDESKSPYSNWLISNSTLNKTLRSPCISISAAGNNNSDEDQGKWEMDDCSERHFVVCQKTQSWSTSKLQILVIDLRNELARTREELKQVLLKERLLELEQGSGDSDEDSNVLEMPESYNDTINTVYELQNNVSALQQDLEDTKQLVATQQQTIQLLSTRCSQADVRVEEMIASNFTNFASQLSTVKSAISGTSTTVSSLESRLAVTNSAIQTDIQGVKRDLAAAKLPPVGFIYIQYSGQSSPTSLWPSASWRDISSTYAGMFFRAVGGTSSSFGQTQGEAAPRITSVTFVNRDTHTHKTSISLSKGILSDPITSGGYDGSWTGIRFLTSKDEVRPINQAILIYRRVA